jgi:hypothetical protein
MWQEVRNEKNMRAIVDSCSCARRCAGLLARTVNSGAFNPIGNPNAANHVSGETQAEEET